MCILASVLVRCNEIRVNTQVCVFICLVCVRSINSSGRKIQFPGFPNSPPHPTIQHTHTHSTKAVWFLSDSARGNTLRQTISTHSTCPGGVNKGLERKYQYSPLPTDCCHCMLKCLSPVCVSVSNQAFSNINLICNIDLRPHCVGNQS